MSGQDDLRDKVRRDYYELARRRDAELDCMPIVTISVDMSGQYALHAAAVDSQDKMRLVRAALVDVLPAIMGKHMPTTEEMSVIEHALATHRQVSRGPA